MLDPKNPETWRQLEEHPSFEEYRFVDNWQESYEGTDPVTDLAGSRTIASLLLQEVPRATVKLEVLDDVSTFVMITIDNVDIRVDAGYKDQAFCTLIVPDSSDINAEGTEVVDLSPKELVHVIVDHVSKRPLKENE